MSGGGTLIDRMGDVGEDGSANKSQTRNVVLWWMRGRRGN